uniref:Uncharacterized protein n=1 Tax=Micrurus spixii TaxID=129469 RepID=A0A2D4MSC4_9SAUR
MGKTEDHRHSGQPKKLNAADYRHIMLIIPFDIGRRLAVPSAHSWQKPMRPKYIDLLSGEDIPLIWNQGTFNYQPPILHYFIISLPQDLLLTDNALSKIMVYHLIV